MKTHTIIPLKLKCFILSLTLINEVSKEKNSRHYKLSKNGGEGRGEKEEEEEPRIVLCVVFHVSLIEQQIVRQL